MKERASQSIDSHSINDANNSKEKLDRIYRSSNRSPIKVDIQVSDFVAKHSSKRSDGSASRI